VGAGIPPRQRGHRLGHLAQERVRQPGGRRHAEGIAVQRGVLGGDPSLLPPDADSRRASLALELFEHRAGRVPLRHPFLALGGGEVAEPAQDLLERVAVPGAGRFGSVLERVLDLGQRPRVDQLPQLLLAEQLP
jgi:hypothetical protein